MRVSANVLEQPSGSRSGRSNSKKCRAWVHDYEWIVVNWQSSASGIFSAPLSVYGVITSDPGNSARRWIDFSLPEVTMITVL